MTVKGVSGIIDIGLIQSSIVVLKLTKKADYGLIALKHLAVRNPAHTASAKDIADAYGIPLPLLSKILQRLSKNGFLKSEQGTNGGYRLARDPRQITALEVIRAIDGPIILTSCFTDDGECHHTGKCSVREPLRKVHEGILRLLNNITMADIAREDMELPAADVDVQIFRLKEASGAPALASK